MVSLSGDRTLFHFFFFFKCSLLEICSSSRATWVRGWWLGALGRCMGDAGGKASTPSGAAYLGLGQHQGPAGIQDGIWGLTPAVSLSGLESLPIVVFNEVTTFERLY